MNTALYCTSTAPTDTYYTHTNLGKAGELRPSLRPRSAAGRRPSKMKDGPRSALWPARRPSGETAPLPRGLLTLRERAGHAAALAKKPRPRPGRRRRGTGAAPGWGP